MKAVVLILTFMNMWYGNAQYIKEITQVKTGVKYNFKMENGEFHYPSSDIVKKYDVTIKTEETGDSAGNPPEKTLEVTLDSIEYKELMDKPRDLASFKIIETIECQRDSILINQILKDSENQEIETLGSLKFKLSEDQVESAHFGEEILLEIPKDSEMHKIFENSFNTFSQKELDIQLPNSKVHSPDYKYKSKIEIGDLNYKVSAENCSIKSSEITEVKGFLTREKRKE